MKLFGGIEHEKLGNVIFLMSRYVLYYGSQFEISQKMMLIFIGGLEKSKACEQFT